MKPRRGIFFSNTVGDERVFNGQRTRAAASLQTGWIYDFAGYRWGMYRKYHRTWYVIHLLTGLSAGSFDGSRDAAWQAFLAEVDSRGGVDKFRHMIYFAFGDNDNKAFMDAVVNFPYF